MQQGLKLNHFVIAGCGLIVILTSVTTYITKKTNQELVTNSNLLSETYALKTNLKELEKLLVDSETGQRGFIITKEEEYLEPFYKAKEKLNSNLTQMERDFRDDHEELKILRSNKCNLLCLLALWKWISSPQK
jgi:methyl-accepting chemotaxis protein WspA